MTHKPHPEGWPNSGHTLREIEVTTKLAAGAAAPARGARVTVEQALKAIGQHHQVHTLAEDPEGNGHLTAAIMPRDTFACLIRMPECKLSVAKQKLVDLKYPLRVQTSQRVFYVFCSEPLCS